MYELTRAFIAMAPPSPTEALDRAIAAAPDNPALRFQRGDLLARHGAWQDALADYKAGLEGDPSDTVNWMSAATLYLQLGDLDGYRRNARTMLDRFDGTTEPMTAERTAKIGLLAQPPDDDLARLTGARDRGGDQGSRLAASPLVSARPRHGRVPQWPVPCRRHLATAGLRLEPLDG